MPHNKRVLKIALYRILGNDLPPRHKKGQTYDNLKFTLENEPVFTNCQKKWIINRIVDSFMEQKITKLLERHKQTYLRIPFEFKEYKTCSARWADDYRVVRRLYSELDPIRYKKIIYVMNNNGARNIALKDGRRIADWILPFDGNCFFTEEGWKAVASKLAVQTREDKCFVVPMYRLTGNKQCFNFKPKGLTENEPQIIFGRDSKIHFDESLRYGAFPKVTMLQKLRFKSQCTAYGFIITDPKYRCGYVLRLFSGVREGERGVYARIFLREKAIDLILRKLDGSRYIQ